MSRYHRHNPNEPVRHDWLEGARRAAPLPRTGIYRCRDRTCGGADCATCYGEQAAASYVAEQNAPEKPVTSFEHPVSSCCNVPFRAPFWPDTDLCAKCGEHAGAVEADVEEES